MQLKISQLNKTSSILVGYEIDAIITDLNLSLPVEGANCLLKSLLAHV